MGKHKIRKEDKRRREAYRGNKTGITISYAGTEKESK